MYGDAYHLSNHGIKPLLPCILPQMSLPKEFLPVIRDYYITLVNTALMEGILTKEETIEIEFDLAEGLQLSSNVDNEIVKSLCDNVRMLNGGVSGELHNKTIQRLRKFCNNKTYRIE